MKKALLVAAVACLGVIWVSAISASTPGADARLTNDCHPDPGCGAGYISGYTLATGVPYTDQTLDECTVSHRRQNSTPVPYAPLFACTLRTCANLGQRST